MYEVIILMKHKPTDSIEIENIIHTDLTEEQACNMIDDIEAEYKDMYKVWFPDK